MVKIKSYLWIHGLLMVTLNLHSAAVAPTILNKIWMHKGAGIELGKLSLYFTAKPSVQQEAPKKSAQNEEMRFFVQNAKIDSPEIESIMHSLPTHSPDQGFSIKMKALRDGIEIMLVYDPQRVGIEYAQFESIGSYKAMGITFYNKQFLKDLDFATNKNMLRTAYLKRPHTVVVDCGHGGKDTGTIGCHSIKEKDITLQVGLQLASLLKDNGFKVVLTRNADYDVSLDKRTHIHESDIFLSIHANNSINKNAKGIETYCFNPDLLLKKFSTLDRNAEQCVKFFDDMRFNHSLSLANHIHTKTVAMAKKKHVTSDRNVRKSVSQVLLAAQACAAALIEIGFLSNDSEALMLNDKEYQNLIALGICQGVISYFDTLKTA